MRIVIDEKAYVLNTRDIRNLLLLLAMPALDSGDDWGGMRPAFKLFIRPFVGILEKRFKQMAPEAYIEREKKVDLLAWIAACGTSVSAAWLEGQPPLLVGTHAEEGADGDTEYRISTVSLASSAKAPGFDAPGDAGSERATAIGQTAGGNILSLPEAIRPEPETFSRPD